MTDRSPWNAPGAGSPEPGASPTRILVLGDTSVPNDSVVQQLRSGFPNAVLRDVCDSTAFEHALEQGDFDLVVTGQKLDWIEGASVARKVRSRWPDRLVVMYTANNGTTAAIDVPSGEFSEHEVEDSSVRKLTSAVRDALEQANGRRAVFEAETRFQGLYDSVPVGLYRTTIDGQIIDVNAAMVQLLNYPDRESLLRANAAAMYVNPLDRERGVSMTRRDGLLQDFEVQLRRYDGSPIWVLDNVRAVRGPGGRVEFFLGSLQDISHRKKTDEVLERSLESLNRAMKGTIEAMAVISEMRDPYTAGHQKRVAKLASAIAVALGLPADRVEGVRLAGLIHDIGKISVPHEILSKPGRLTTIEFNLIRVHPEVGYEVLKRVDFPWPLAKIVLQHHEVLDGSGYPYGVKAEEILLEARIIGVADVVEAMASHRPYRPSLGIERALEQVEEFRGRLYDSKVVGACLELFDSGFAFE
ncbi:MAG: HD domain-containing protein [Deltaproteobacteria bacterium]|nr:HD domain-containing protein [Deltaproteobacteria bacterium]